MPRPTPDAAAAEPRKRTRDPQRGAKILEAARRLFYERGFHAVSVDEIGEAAGATGAAIYRYFSGKEEILSTLFDEAQERYLTGVPDVQEDPAAELEELIARHLELTFENRELASIWARETRALSDGHLRRLRRRERQYVERWVACLQRCYPARDAAELATAAAAAIGLTTSLASRPSRIPAARELELARGMVTAALGSLGTAR